MATSSCSVLIKSLLMLRGNTKLEMQRQEDCGKDCEEVQKLISAYSIQVNLWREKKRKRLINVKLSILGCIKVGVRLKGGSLIECTCVTSFECDVQCRMWLCCLLAMLLVTVDDRAVSN